MFCKYCGNALQENASFCPVCGKITKDTNGNEEISVTELYTQQEVIEDTDMGEMSNPFKTEKQSLGGNILKFAILGLAFGVTMYLSFLGVFFSVIAQLKLNEYKSKFIETEGRATVGKSLSIAGMIVSIVFSCLLILIIILKLTTLN